MWKEQAHDQTQQNREDSNVLCFSGGDIDFKLSSFATVFGAIAHDKS
jgi:hypothetical protein